MENTTPQVYEGRSKSSTPDYEQIMHKVVMVAVHDCGFELIDHAPYSPDLASIATTDLCAREFFPDEAEPLLQAFQSVFTQFSLPNASAK